MLPKSLLAPALSDLRSLIHLISLEHQLLKPFTLILNPLKSDGLLIPLIDSNITELRLECGPRPELKLLALLTQSSCLIYLLITFLDSFHCTVPFCQCNSVQVAHNLLQISQLTGVVSPTRLDI